MKAVSSIRNPKTGYANTNPIYPTHISVHNYKVTQMAKVYSLIAAL
jgi:hypothetical protein